MVDKIEKLNGFTCNGAQENELIPEVMKLLCEKIDELIIKQRSHENIIDDCLQMFIKQGNQLAKLEKHKMLTSLSKLPFDQQRTIQDLETLHRMCEEWREKKKFAEKMIQFSQEKCKELNAKIEFDYAKVGKCYLFKTKIGYFVGEIMSIFEDSFSTKEIHNDHLTKIHKSEIESMQDLQT